MADIVYIWERTMSKVPQETRVLAATRCLLAGMAAWTTNVFDPEAAERLAGTTLPIAHGGDSFDEKDWSTPGCAGLRVEQSLVLTNMPSVFRFATTGIWHGDLEDLGGTKWYLNPFRYALKWTSGGEFGLVDEAEEPILALEAVEIVESILEIFNARVSMLHGWPLEITQLAALAGLAEKTVRMAATGREKNPELATFKDGNNTRVSVEEAQRWLSTKSGYRPTVLGNKDSPLPGPRSPAELGRYLVELRERRKVTAVELTARLGWDQVTHDAYVRLESGSTDFDLSLFPVEALIRLASILSPDQVPQVARAVGVVLAPYQVDQEVSRRFPYSGDANTAGRAGQ